MSYPIYLRLLTLWALFAAGHPTASAMSCGRLDPDTPPLDAKEQRVYDTYLQARAQARATLAAATDADPMLRAFKARVEAWDAADDSDDPFESMSPRLLANEAEALLFQGENTSDDADAISLSRALVQRWQHSAPAWSLHAALRLELDGEPLAANRALRAYLARSDGAGAYDLALRQNWFRLLGHQLRHPEPELPVTLEGRVRPRCEYGPDFLIEVASETVTQPEFGAASKVEEAFCDSDALALEPGLDTAEEAQALRERPALCAALHASLRAQSTLYAARKDDLEDEWEERCMAAAHAAVGQADWRRAMDALARDGCPRVTAAQSGTADADPR